MIYAVELGLLVLGIMPFYVVGTPPFLPHRPIENVLERLWSVIEILLL